MLMANIGWFLWNGASGSWVRECGFFASSTGKLCLAVYAAVAILSTSAIPFSRMSKEDEVLKRKFGSQWDDWARRVPYLVIPGVY
jgi:protein-S-isoprenylcysteine O-methyltransferase Ste14